MSLTDQVKLTTSLIAIPLGVDSAPAAVIIADKLSFKTKVVITWDVDLANSTPHSNVDVLRYDQLSRLNDTTDGVIIFDSLQQFLSVVELTVDNKTYVGINSVVPLREKRNSLIWLCSFGIRMEDIQLTKEISPSTLLLQSKFLDLGENLKFNLHTSEMTMHQQHTYAVKQTLQASEPEQIRQGEVLAQEACNIAYPDDIEAKLGTLQKLPPFAEIIKGVNLTQLLNDAPKLRQLSSFIALHRDKRHVVYTRYAYHYGAQLLVYLLKHFVSSSVYEMHSLDEQNQNMPVFNATPSAPGIIVTTTSLDMGTRPLNVNYLHLVDGSLSKVDNLLINIYKYNNYIGVRFPPLLSIHSYVCAMPMGQPLDVDETSYSEFQKKYKQLEEQWNKLLHIATYITSGPNGDLIVS